MARDRDTEIDSDPNFAHGYAKGGAAWERDSYLQFFPATGATFATGSETRSGWTVALGGEYAFWRTLSAVLEYDYCDFGAHTVTFASGTTSPQIRIRKTQSIVKAGLNWRFDWGGPVVARY